MLAPLLRPLRGHVQRITEQADAEARQAGLTVEVLAGGVRRYRDPRLDGLAAHTATGTTGQYTDVRDPVVREATPWSTPTLTTTAPVGWSR